MDRAPATVPLWADRIGPLVHALAGSDAATRQCQRAELWRLLHGALFGALRAQAGRIAPVTQEDLEDLASAKALELLVQAEESRWEVGRRGAGEVAGFVWRVARNGLVDLARKRGREAPPPADAAAWDHALAERAGREAGPMELTVAGEFVADLGGCLEGLSQRSRAAWYRRVVLERPTRETARELGLKAPHVDVLVKRARAALAQCMRGKGHAASDVHPQAFVLLWSAHAQCGFLDPPATAPPGPAMLKLAEPSPTDGLHG